MRQSAIELLDSRHGSDADEHPVKRCIMVINCPGYSQEFDPGLIFRKILVPIDFTPESRRALITACEVRTRFGAEIHLFVATDFGHGSGLRGLGVVWGRDGALQDAKDRLHSFAESICKGMPCLTNHATFGEDIVKGIAEAAKECGATMVIMGAHDKHSRLRTRSELIVKALDIPVLVLKNTDGLRALDAAAAGAESEHERLRHEPAGEATPAGE